MEERRMAANRRIRTAVVGAGVFGGRHAEKHAMLDSAELIAIVDPDLASARAVADKTGAVAYADISELPDDIEAASVACTTVAHHPVGMALLRRGVHLLIEKPIADRVELGEELAAEAEARGLVLQVGHIERYSGAYEALRERVTTPLFIECDRIAPFTGRSSDVNVVLDLMIHDLDLIAALVGAPVARIEAVGAPVLTEREDIANARITFETGCVANITASRVSFKTERRLRIFQPDGYISADLHARKVNHIRRLPSKTPGGERALEGEEVALPQADNLLNEVRLFLDAVAEGTTPRVTARDGVDALRTALAIGVKLEAHRARLAETLGAAPPI
jgi:predicted dehydrogenase